MRLKRHVQLLESTLKHVSARPFLSSQCNRCHFSSTSGASSPEQIAVLGGGISGLSSAYFTALEFPNTKITIYERSEELGGWIRSKRVKVPGGEVVFEQGPRTLRPAQNSLVTAMMIDYLDLRSQVLFTQQNSAAARNRYIYYPDRLLLLPAPGSNDPLVNWLRLANSGLLDGVWKVLTEAWKPGRPANMTDESLGSFLSRRIDKRPVQNIASAVMHGIYAGDIWQLSAKTLAGWLWHQEGRSGSITRGLWRMNEVDPPVKGFLALRHPYDVDLFREMRAETDGIPTDFIQQLASCSTFSFKNGLCQLTDSLEAWLEKDSNVTIKKGCRVNSFTKAKDGLQQVVVDVGDDPNRTTHNYDLVISTLPTPDVTDYVTVMTVNLYFPTPNLTPVQGFGYLIPQSVPFEQNPERALGVIFDSDAITGQDTAPGTKLTVMLGGHWWSGWQSFPSSSEGVEMAKSVIRRHLKITEEPIAVNATLSENCIPQYTVGYEERLKGFAIGAQNEFGGRLRVVSNQFNGIGVNDCITGAWDMARNLRGEGWKSKSCGLDRVLDERPWVPAEHWSPYVRKKE
ncbi:Protoporphyrinogen oxidase [Lindgomyces ingoldianus]|uniref:Protoporphyrinogen oxidase n=1 Tax=Lindgomyces ingoldianus TaxID=673940 RepID=A0ACB6RGN8_9PLEO|nr:Protoporphyrinogen oxidase [Lindgomyces ingoldianus]KAF2478292.1 Protoporphyrinogen oxidase [Lindgomyces ingoldianus]